MDMEVLNLSVSASRERLMLDDIDLLYAHERFTSCFLLMMCFIDALASPDRDSDRGSFTRFVRAQLPALCEALSSLHPRDPAELIYDGFRNGLTHRLGVKHNLAMCRDAEVGGVYAAMVPHPGGGAALIGVNVDRLFADFRGLLVSRRAGVKQIVGSEP